MRRTRTPKPKKVAFELIDPTSVAGHPMYRLLAELITAHHEDLAGARLALAWCTSWSPDVDGRVTIGKCKRASDLDRELAAFDFVILLRRAFWLDTRVSDLQRTALLDHELHHAAVKLDKHGDPALDDRGRIVYRTRRHDLEEFTSVVDRYGLWTADLERFAAALRKSATEPFKACEKCQETPGWIRENDPAGTSRVTRCACWLQWSGQRFELKAEQAVAS